MSLAQYEIRTTEPEAREHVVKFVGGTNAVTKVFGKGMTVTYVSTGVVKISWSDTAENPGTFIGLKSATWQATTPGDLKGFTVVHEAYVASTRSVLVNIYNSSFTLANLAALNWLTLTWLFTETKGLF